MPGNPGVSPSAFDAVAADYDAGFSYSALGQLLRRRVWQALAGQFQPGDRILELACGTGEDAVWLARRGLRVTALDASAAMLAIAARKIEQASLDSRVSLQRVTLQQLITGDWHPDGPGFDGVLSNFGGLNTISNWRGLAARLAAMVKPGGRMVLVPMGPYCPWELLWYGSHGRFDLARRRWQPVARATLGSGTIPVWYPAARQLRRELSPWFRHLSTRSLGLWLPPSYLGALVQRQPRLFNLLNRLEGATASLTGGWGDHYISLFARR